MEREVLVKVEGVSKKFSKDLKRSLRYGLADITRGLFKTEMKTTLRKDEFWAVKDVSFEVRRGECLGLIGHNGAGKSTLLKMLNGLISPDEGKIEMRGRVGALIELGAGFNPVLTGRENIYNNGAVLGFSRAEIDAKLPEIIAFSELEDYLDMPVQNYSSGMRVRLGFAVAAQMEPDILLVDEVLAVGDMGFILKCYNEMDRLLKNTAIILVSHAMPQIARMSTKLILLEKGITQYISENVSDGLTEYYKRYKLEIGNYQGSSKVEFNNWNVLVGKKSLGQEDDIVINYGDDLNLQLSINCLEKIYNPTIYLAIYDKEQRNFCEIRNFKEDLIIQDYFGNLILNAIIPNIQFAQGKYSITIGMSETKNDVKETLFRYQSAIYFTVNNTKHGWAPLQLQAKWEEVKN